MPGLIRASVDGKTDVALTSADVARLYRNQGKEPPPEFADAPALKKRVEKYGRIQKTLDGITFDSTSEANAYAVLKVWERAGLIDELVLQPRFVLQERLEFPEPRIVCVKGVLRREKGLREIGYVADFSYMPHGAERRIVADVKGVQTPAFRIKAKLFRAKFPDLDLQVWDRETVKEMSRC
jgi:hypothetical protein